jgi:hypothetical protein
MNSRRLYEFLEFLNLEKKFKRGIVTGRNRPKAVRVRPGPVAKSACAAQIDLRSRARAGVVTACCARAAVDSDSDEEVLQLWWHDNEHR